MKLELEPKPAVASIFFLEPEPSQLRRSRNRGSARASEFWRRSRPKSGGSATLISGYNAIFGLLLLISFIPSTYIYIINYLCVLHVIFTLFIMAGVRRSDPAS